MCSARMLVLLIVVATAAVADPVQSAKPPLYDVGEPMVAEQIAAIDISVLPNGSGLPLGRGTAREGAAVYATHCAACHGDHGEGRGDFMPLIGGRGSLATPKPLLTVGSYWPTATTVFDYIRRAMPYNTPGVLSTDEVYAVTAWILEKNQILPPGASLDRRSLPTVRMPNRDGFVADPRPDVSDRSQP